MSLTIERTPFKWEKDRVDNCCPGSESCLPRARPALGASVSEWHNKTVRWVSWGTEAGWHVPVPSSRRDGNEEKWMCPPFLTQAKQHRRCFSVGLKGCHQQHLSPNRLLRKTTTRMLLQKSFVFNCRCTECNITNGADVH